MRYARGDALSFTRFLLFSAVSPRILPSSLRTFCSVL